MRIELAGPLKYLHWGFWGCIASFAFAMGADHVVPASPSGQLLIYALLAAFFACACLYWVSLGVLARRTGRSAALWIVAGLATLAIGFIVTYILMATRVRRELRAKTA